jgi:hypothetical protein
MKITKRQRKALKGPNAAVKASKAYYKHNTTDVAGTTYIGKVGGKMPWVRW